MKKIITLSLFVALFSNASAQVLQRIENWPNASWSVGGTYTPAALVFNPTVNDKFKYDASLVVPSGLSSVVFTASPFFDLKPAFDAGEKVFRIDFNISFETFVNSVLTAQYWDADSSTWVTMPDGNAPADVTGDFSTCTNVPVTLLFNFTSFTINKLQNFRYRFSINDAGSQLAGVCISSPIVTSFLVLPPSGLNASNIDATNATLDWVGNNGFGMDTSYELEYGPQGFVLGTGTLYQNSFPPVVISGLTPGANYDFYVRENLYDTSVVLSSWAGPQSFTTATLGIEENEFNKLKFYPNPTKDIIWLDSQEIINEIKVFNLTGQELLSVKSGGYKLNVDLTGLNEGLYFLNVNSESSSTNYIILKK